MSVVPTRRALPPGSCSSSAAVLTRLPLWPIATVRARPMRKRRLAVLPDRGAGRGVAAVGDGEVAAQRRPGAARRAPGRPGPGPCRPSRPSPSLTRDAGRFLAAMLQREETPARRGRPPPGPGAWTPTTPHMSALLASHASSPRTRGRPASQAWRSSASGSSSSSATPAPRSSAAPVAPTPTSRMRSRSPPTVAQAPSGDAPCSAASARERVPVDPAPC